MESIKDKDLETVFGQKEYTVMLFSSALDVNSVLAENALDSLMDAYKYCCVFCKSDVSEDVGLAKRYSILSVPRILVFRGGSLLEEVTGLMSHAVLKGFLDRTVIHR